MNQMRGLLAETVGHHDERVSELLRAALVEISERLRSFEQRLERHDRQIEEFARLSQRRRCAVLQVRSRVKRVAGAGAARTFQRRAQNATWD